MYRTRSGRPSATLEASAAASAPAPRQQRAQHRGVDTSHPQTKRQTTRRSCAASARCSRRPRAAKNGNGLAGAAGSARCCSIAALLSRLCTPPLRQSQAARCATAQPAQHSSRTMGRSARASAARQDLVHASASKLLRHGSGGREARAGSFDTALRANIVAVSYFSSRGSRLT